jgi:hypothetical protein
MRIHRPCLFALVASICCIASAGVARADIVTNGGFETGDFSGWTQSGNTDFTGVTTGIAHSGDFAADLGPDGSLGYLSQTLATTAGTTYQLTFFLASDGQVPNEFQVTLGGTVWDQADVPSFGYVSESLTVTATASTTLLQFGFQNDNGSFALDDVSVNSVPEPGSLMLLGLGTSVAFASIRLRRRSSGARR